ncbi:hypothetical protein SCFA_1150004 [anaerobic digester metagenome]|uniref:Uncharacterized protein n=1 Tax=anaerobic digester metagenome TaxID=1263854 RepID=A0A485LUN6_9ZZZZ
MYCHEGRGLKIHCYKQLPAGLSCGQTGGGVYRAAGVLVTVKKKAGLFDLRTYEEVLRGMNLEEPYFFYRHNPGLLNPPLADLLKFLSPGFCAI